MGNGKLTKFGAGDLIYKKALAKAAAFDVGEFAKKIAEDAGAMVKVSKLNDFAKALKSADCKKPVVHMGVSKGDLVITVQSADGFKDTEVIVKDYAKMKAARANVAVVNAQKGDDTIDSSSDRMSKAKGTKTQDKKDAKLKDEYKQNKRYIQLKSKVQNSRSVPCLTSFFNRTNPTAGPAKHGNPATALSLQNLQCYPGG